MANWQVGPPKKKGRYHIAYFDDDQVLRISEAHFDGKSNSVNSFDTFDEETYITFEEYTLELKHIEAHKPYPTITKHWIQHLKETKRR